MPKRPRGRPGADEDDEAVIEWVGSPVLQEGGNKFFRAFALDGRPSDPVAVGDTVSFRVAAGHKDVNPDRREWLGRVARLWEDAYGECWLQVAWLYFPEETPTGRLPSHLPGEVFLSAHLDANTIDAVERRVELSSVPDRLPCREAERASVRAFLEGGVRAGTAKSSLYLSGMPGTGKTATVREVLAGLRASAAAGELAPFDEVWVNALALSHPHQLYSTVWRALTTRNAAPARAAQLLEARFSAPSAGRRAVVLVVDELDCLVTRKQTVLYNLLDWPSRRHARLVVVGIANTMDLPERMLPRVHSRLGLARVVFQPYTRDQIRDIVCDRLSGLSVFRSDAVEMAARKVAALSGDAAARELSATRHATALRGCGLWERVLVVALVLHLRAAGASDGVLPAVHRRLCTLLRSHVGLSGAKLPTLAEAGEMAGRLGDTRLLLLDNSKSSRWPTLRLGMQPDDVIFALREDSLLSKMLD
ncbi:hypothetical protein FNF29_04843 [Cafeteria roenbergensis]|uniref:Origin recognition complex subunit 1 n=1 Tax=Cafeteria roenbergensis TaxID=33653 RepID=A0A5A8CCT6_CAFRO|nr:hypothetical protein FNF29_04843 [Cafeteria roenbergensis]|eukprot:KAA0150953.1 hypothetical protein FNF29_04843 [Cafeteria roenbergensis]